MMWKLGRPQLGRRSLLATAGTLITTLPARKLLAADNLPKPRLTLLSPPEPAPEIVFVQADGTEHTLEKFRGHGMVINFWATWCAPCVAEMPALADLSRALAPHNIAVMPLSSDRGGANVVRKFYETQKIAALPILLDPRGAAANAFKARGLPSTVIIDKKGQIRAKLEGAANWAHPDIATEIRQMVG